MHNRIIKKIIKIKKIYIFCTSHYKLILKLNLKINKIKKKEKNLNEI